MKTIDYPRVEEQLVTEQLPNGLKVYVLPKKGFSKTYAVFTTHYGSIDNQFQVEGKERHAVPDGIAHFLEHKMFEEPTGDIFATFAAQGASANAFTSFDRTSYLFTATGEVLENLDTLLNFVQNPYFTDENVEKEKGIIGQEIQMYRDHPDWRSYFGLIEAMYRVHPVHIDIAGTIESIGKITKEMLYDCYRTFYHPSNMRLFVVGGVDPQQVIERVKQNQAGKTFEPQGKIHRFFDEEPLNVNESVKTTVLPISLPKCLFGIKEPKSGLTGEELLRRELTMKLVMDVLLSPSSSLYEELYDEGLISDSFGFEYNCTSDYAFSMMGGDTKDPDALIERVQKGIDKHIASGLDEAAFQRSRNKKIGGYLRLLNSPEAIANEFVKYELKQGDFFNILPIYESITLEEANQRMREHFDWSQMAVSIVKSEGQ